MPAATTAVFDFLGTAGSAAEAIPAASDLKTPMTIFYDGRVSVFQVSPEQAEKIMRAARSEEEATLKLSGFAAAVASRDEQQNKLLLEKFNGGVQSADQARRKSLQTFLAKRKERVVSLSPYTLNGSDCAGVKK